MTKLFQADAALVGLLASVDAHVHGEGAELGEGAVAEGALVRFLAGVNALVNLRGGGLESILMMLQSL